ncbi:MAG: ribbon-helix-helix protein, CopG family [Deltaproteobacteria bacterium]|nr:ribbon-helix-helix protein, CopG family [Deltaproteobacteria bacterium]
MKRTQIYLEEEDFEILQKIGEKRRQSVSALIRYAIRTTFRTPKEGLQILKDAAGLWEDRTFETDQYVRLLREDDRVRG